MRSSAISYLGWEEKDDTMFIRVPLELYDEIYL